MVRPALHWDLRHLGSGSRLLPRHRPVQRHAPSPGIARTVYISRPVRVAILRPVGYTDSLLTRSAIQHACSQRLELLHPDVMVSEAARSGATGRSNSISL
jgi:hypothetical protein